MNKQKESYKVIALMSGTSLDGLDIACIQFKAQKSQWTHSIICAETLDYSNEIGNMLSTIERANGNALIKAHFQYGHYLGEQASIFIKENHLGDIDFIASHGHTIFHQPDLQFTFQLGHGAAIAASSKNIVISDFRSLDVALGGEGAPLVPLGDRLLFSEYGACVNLGGIANISFDETTQRRGFDVCAVNMVLNHLCQTELQLPFDQGGNIARSGKFSTALFEKLNSLSFFKKLPPKSLGKEWVFTELIPLLNEAPIPIQDKLHTFCHHVAEQLQTVIHTSNLQDPILFTGGGALNSYLMECIKLKVPRVHVPDRNTIDFKEAIIFGLLGVLRIREEENSLMSITGAESDSSGGSIYLPPCSKQ